MKVFTFILFLLFCYTVSSSRVEYQSQYNPKERLTVGILWAMEDSL